MKKTHLPLAFIAATLVALNLQAQTAHPAVLTRDGALPATTVIAAPKMELPHANAGGLVGDDNEFVLLEVSDFLKGR